MLEKKIGKSSIPKQPMKVIIPEPKNQLLSTPIDPKTLTSVLSPFNDFSEFKRQKELKKLQELEELWSFFNTKTKGPILDVYLHLQDLCEDSSQLVSETAERMTCFLDSTRMRGG